MNPIYIPNFLDNPDAVFGHCMRLPWWKVVEARKEYFMAQSKIRYDYGKDPNIRTYHSVKFTDEILNILSYLNHYRNSHHNMCFFNRYDNEQNQLGWHADNSPTMDSNHDISVISPGAEREIWWKLQTEKGKISDANKQRLAHGSLFVMPAGFQDTMFHRIPKSDRPCDVRISLTFRKHLNIGIFEDDCHD